MDMTLSRFAVGPNGSFGYIKNCDGAQVCMCAEHAYLQDEGDLWLPKVPPGRYLCQRGIHVLTGGLPFETFQVTAVPGHTGILFHKGNLPEIDSQGCILLGSALGSLEGQSAVLGSADAFAVFMGLQAGVNEFWLTVE